MNHYRLNKLFAACQAVIPSRSFISTLSLSAALTLQLGLVTPTFAVDATTTTATDPTIETATSVVEIKAVSPAIDFFLENDADITMEFRNIDYGDVSKFMFQEQDITETIKSLITAEAMIFGGDKGGFSLKLRLDNPKSLEGLKFGVDLANGTTVIKPIKFNIKTDDKAGIIFGVNANLNINANIDANTLIDQYFKYTKDRTISSISGTVCRTSPYSLERWANGCSPPISTGKIKLYRRGKSGTTETWYFMGDTDVRSDGSYYFSGPLGINGKNYCGPVLVKFSKKDGEKCTTSPNNCSYTYDSCTVTSERVLNIVYN
jgi:hypothetical protein